MNLYTLFGEFNDFRYLAILSLALIKSSTIEINTYSSPQTKLEKYESST